MGTVQLLPWCDDTREMDDIYVSLELEKRGCGSSMLKSNEDLVTLKLNNKPATRVLVKGVAGSGKSTLLAKLAYNWAQQKCDSPLSSFDLVFILSLREVQRRQGLIDAIFQQILAKDTKVSVDELQKFIEDHPSKVLILLDGFDEYIYDVARLSGIDGILHYEVLRDCHVIVSTRPHKHFRQHQSCHVSVNLTGFSPENVKLYMKKFFKGNTEMVDGLSNRLKESEILTSLSNIPVILMLMCLLWEDEQKLPDTQSELYQDFALYLWRKYCIKQGKQAEDDSDAEFKKAISELGQIAFEGLCPKGNIKEEKLVFSEKDFSEISQTQSLFDLGCETGLLTRERLRSKLNMISHVTFLHKSFQEYCAAKYWASLFDTDSDQFQSILKQICTWDVLLSKIELLKLCCGLVDKAGRIDIIHHAIHVFECSAYMDDTDCVQVGSFGKEIELSPILNLLYESQITPSDDSSSRLQTNRPIQYEHASADNTCTMLSTEDQQQSSKVMLSLDRALKSLFSKLKLVVYGYDPQTLSIFHKFVKSAYGLSSLAKIKSVRFDHPTTASSLDVITDALQCMPDVQEIGMHNKVLRSDHRWSDKVLPGIEQSMKRLGEKLSTLPKCTTITIWHTSGMIETRIDDIVHGLSLSSHYTHIKFICVRFNSTYMAQLLSKTNLLKTLDLHNNAMLPGDVMSILDAIQSNIEHLTLGFNHVAEAIGHIGHIMTPHLQTLDLIRAILKEDHITVLSEFLPKAPNLESLDLSLNSVGMAIVPLAQQLRYCTRLSRLELYYAHITDKGIIELAKRFAFMSNLSSLNIGSNEIVNSGIHAVFKHLHHLIKLETLCIDATIDNQCSDLVKDCLCAIGETIPDAGSHKISIYRDSQVQLLIKTATKHTEAPAP
ncbi:uncharacterized protein [Amphiura filiformis]|uniref:uncharacterized protein n=1 Tax=Amphiura filiformis TaxID=82378 RepID=UPI003B2240F7